MSFARFYRLAASWIVSLAAAATASAGTTGILFSDDFTGGASPLWGNERGDWVASGGVYDAREPEDRPLTYSSLPFELTDFAVDVDILGVSDGGLWLRSDPAGLSGVLFVTVDNNLYWEIVQGGEPQGVLNEVSGLFEENDDIHVRVEVAGTSYAAFVNGSDTPATTLTTDQFSSGRVGLYDFSGQTFDNVQVVPLPPAVAAGGIGLLGVMAFQYQCRRRRLGRRQGGRGRMSFSPPRREDVVR